MMSTNAVFYAILTCLEGLEAANARCCGNMDVTAAMVAIWARSERTRDLQ